MNPLQVLETAKIEMRMVVILYWGRLSKIFMKVSTNRSHTTIPQFPGA